MTSRTIVSKIHCASPAEKIYDLLNTNEGRKKFWAEAADETGDTIYFVFPNGQTFSGRILSSKRERNSHLIILGVN